MQFGNPLSLQGPLPGNRDLLFTAAIPGAVTTVISGNVNLAKAYTAILVRVDCAPVATAGNVPLCAQATINANAPTPPAYSCALGAQPASGGFATYQGIMPFNCSPGDIANFQANFQGAGITGRWSVWGLSNYPVLSRTDGRAYPIGALTAQGTTLAGGTLVPGVAGFRVLLKYGNAVVQSNGAPGGFVQLAGVISGSSVFIGGQTAQTNFLGGGPIPMPPDGILLDAGQPLTYVTGGVNAAVVVDAIYDLTV